MSLPKPPAAVTFDCWSTLITDISWERTVSARVDALRRAAKEHGVDLEPERGLELIEGSWQEHVVRWRGGEVYGPSAASEWCLQKLGLTPTEELVASLAEAIGSATSEAGTEVVPGAPEVLRDLRDAGIPTALICDTGFTPGHHVRRFLDEHGCFLDHYFFSDEVGVPKPDPRIFRSALAAIDAPAERSIHIGDLRRTDVAGARSVGMATIRFTGVHDDGWAPEETSGEEADAVLGSWKELPDLLGL